ncbi:hypothetical protein V1290_003790 [Bradyrhizobium sp. AZCC 1578]|uniref:hypothetical protein n=1 Tax=Bradyrhizobium sp. AZCC 1578 TaxID=3117027 RepID=UPI002FEEC3D0
MARSPSLKDQLADAVAELKALREAIDAAVIEALATNSLHALADLVTNPEIAERLRGKRIGEPYRDQTMVQAYASVILLRQEIKEKRPAVLIPCVGALHYGNPEHAGSVITKIVGASLKNAALGDEARELANWLRESPPHMQRLRDVQAQFAAVATTPTKMGANSLGEDDGEDDG